MVERAVVIGCAAVIASCGAKTGSGGAWRHQIGDRTSSIAAEAIDVGPTGDVTAVYERQATQAKDRRLFVVRYRVDGVVQWSVDLRPPACPRIDFAPHVRVLRDGSAVIVAAAGFYDSNGASAPLCIVKLDRAGRAVWSHLIEGSAPLGSLAVAPTGRIFVAGVAGSTGTREGFISSWDADGELRWRKAVPQIPSGVGAGPNGTGIALLRSHVDIDPATPQLDNVRLLAMSPDGAVRWERHLFDAMSQYVESPQYMTVDASGAVYVGLRERTGVVLTKFTADGQPGWSRSFAADGVATLAAGGNYRIAIAAEQGPRWAITVLSTDGAEIARGAMAALTVDSLVVGAMGVFAAGSFSDTGDFGSAGRATTSCSVKTLLAPGHPPTRVKQRVCSQEGYVVRLDLSR